MPSTIIPVASVWASGQSPGDDAKNVIDGTRTTKWSCFGVGSNITLDFKRPFLVTFVKIAWYRGESRQYKFIIELSNDMTTWTKVFDGISSGAPTDDGYENVDSADLQGRYMRITVNGSSESDWASIMEVKPYGSETAPAIESTVFKIGINADRTAYDASESINMGATAELDGLPLMTTLYRFVDDETTPRDFAQTDGTGSCDFPALSLTAGNHKVTIAPHPDKADVVRTAVNFSIRSIIGPPPPPGGPPPPPPPPPPGNPSVVQLYIPMYGSDTTTFAKSLNSLYPTLRKVCTINPCSGPGSAFRQDIFDTVAFLKQNTYTKVVAYIPTKYATGTPTTTASGCWPAGSPRDSGAMHAMIDQYLAWYPAIDGFYLDEQNSSSASIAFYQDIRSYANARFAALGKPVPFIVGNPGTDCAAQYGAILDNIHIWENNVSKIGLPPVSTIQSEAAKFGSSKIGIIPYGAVTLDTSWLAAIKPSLIGGTIYVTDHGISDDAWQVRCTYWQALIAALF